MLKKNIAVVMGGYSSEFEISLKSGKVVCENIPQDFFNVYPVHILKEGWFYVDTNNQRHMVNKADFSFALGDKIIVPDAVFNTIHGTPGEDGKLGAYWELLGIPQTSTGYYQAALSFNKRDCLAVLKKFGINCAKSIYINKDTSFTYEEIIASVGLPCFVKPNRSGSSFGVSKVNNKEKLPKALDYAFQEDHQLIIESALVGIEVSVGVFNNQGEIVAFTPTEIVSENDFFDYEAKYLGKSQEITPARISKEIENLVKEEAKKIYKILNMKGVTRSDFIIQNGIPFFIETNTTPGLSNESIIPKQAKEAGISLGEFFKILIEQALSKK